MKRNWLPLFLILGILVPLSLGNKGCEKVSKFEHPTLQKGQACGDCHDDGRTPETKPKWHDLGWGRTHGQWVTRYGLKSKDTCLLCHNESKCTSCHQIEKPRDHTEFWRLKGHALMVGLDRSRCYSCHRTDFCQRCHANTPPMDHSAAWGTPGNRHCLGCHFPLASVGAQRCASCHAGTPSHANTPHQPSNALHGPGANCRSCHTPLRHPDNGMNCAFCHPR